MATSCLHLFHQKTYNTLCLSADLHTIIQAYARQPDAMGWRKDKWDEITLMARNMLIHQNVLHLFFVNHAQRPHAITWKSGAHPYRRPDFVRIRIHSMTSEGSKRHTCGQSSRCKACLTCCITSSGTISAAICQDVPTTSTQPGTESSAASRVSLLPPIG